MTQSYANHRRFFPLFHFFVLPIFLLNLIWTIYQLTRGFTYGRLEWLVMAVAFICLALSARMMALTVQDRVIRLEMRLRMERILPADLRPRIGEFTMEQLVALRFASDEELPELARKVLTEPIEKRDPIKKMVKNWKGDFLRA